MHFKVHFERLALGILLMQIFTCGSLPCDSCGKECASACGTKHFRTCCFNYLRKRTDPNAMKMKIMNKRLIDIMMLHGQAFYTQNDYDDNDNENNNDIDYKIKLPQYLEEYSKQSSGIPNIYTLNDLNTKDNKEMRSSFVSSTLRTRPRGRPRPELSLTRSQLDAQPPVSLLASSSPYFFNNDTFTTMGIDLQASFYND